jgi:hypothetical protein
MIPRVLLALSRIFACLALTTDAGDPKYHVDCGMHRSEPKGTDWKLYQCILAPIGVLLAHGGIQRKVCFFRRLVGVCFRCFCVCQPACLCKCIGHRQPHLSLCIS